MVLLVVICSSIGKIELLKEIVEDNVFWDWKISDDEIRFFFKLYKYIVGEKVDDMNNEKVGFWVLSKENNIFFLFVMSGKEEWVKSILF